ncbi:molybdopterin-dependent oxidoreductase [Chloroflexota bacterium]
MAIQTGVEIKNIVCGLCSVHCRAKVKVYDGKVTEQYYEVKKPGRSYQRWRTVIASCSRARSAAELIDHPQRLNYPLKRAGERGENKWQRVTWDEALDDIASRLAGIRDGYGAEAVAFSTAGENNCAEEYRSRFQAHFGTPNLASQAQVCYGVAEAMALAMIGGVVNLAFPTQATKCLMMLGANPSPAAPYLWYQMLDLKKNGLKIITIDPRVSESASISDIHLQLRPGTDTALLLGMLNVIIGEGLYDREFVNGWCLGFDGLAERVKQYPPEKAADITSVPAEKIRAAARMYAANKPGLIYHSMGLEQIPNATYGLQARLILSAITGNVDVAGGDLINPPHPTARLASDIECSDVMSPEQEAKLIGCREYPFYSSWATFHKLEDNTRKVRNRRLTAYWFAGFGHSPSIWRAMITGKPYPVKGLITEATNPLLTMPNPRIVYDAMKAVGFHVGIDVFMTPSCLMADYVLPAACYLEKPIMSGGDYYPLISAGEAAIPPMYERRAEYDIWRELGLRLGQESHWPWKTLEESYDWRLEPLGVTFKELVNRGGDSPSLQSKNYQDSGFGTPSGKIELAPSMLEELGIDPLPSYTEWSQGWASPEAEKYPMTLITGARNRHYYHSQGRQTDMVRRKSPDPLAQIHPDKAQELGLKDGDWIWIENRMGRVKFKCKCSKGILPDVVSAEHGWWFPEDPAAEPSLHGLWRSNINILADDGPEFCDPISGGWVLRGIQCRVYKASD